ncbi:hypothetical protein GCM10023322_10130 [Rugosimonospora acidiphila]|uniref:Ig-like domain-containing protein n=1 Tax=Rugosimonospora acidiphila TaxID=556531 RepID=A0ABP9RLV4_9ACTN
MTMYGGGDQDGVTVNFDETVRLDETAHAGQTRRVADSADMAETTPLPDTTRPADTAGRTIPVGTTVRTDPDRLAVTRIDHTAYVEARDDSAGATVPETRDPSVDPPPQTPVGLPRRIPAHSPARGIEPDLRTPTEFGMGSGDGAAPVRIGRGVIPPTKPANYPDVRSMPRRIWGRTVRVLSSLATVVLIAAAAWTGWQWWQHLHNKVQVAHVTVAPAQRLDGQCDVQYDIVGTIVTNGKSGTISYEWLRSDGQTSGTLTQSVGLGQRSTTVHLYWKFTGEGSLTASATLHLLSPQAPNGSAHFGYSCG